MAQRPTPRELDQWARRHHGVVTKAASGLSDSAWKRAVQGGRLIPLHPGVARLPGTATTREQRIAAALLACSPGALASHRSATYLWGVPRPTSDPVDLIVTDRSGPYTLSGVRVHRPRDVLDLTPQRRSNISCTTIVRTLCDLGAVDRGAVTGAVGHALTMRLATLDALESALRDHSGHGRSGVAALRSAIDAFSIDQKPADSILEGAMRRLVDRYRLPSVEFHPVVEGWEVDFRVVGTPVLLECDGWTYHGLHRTTFERDRERDASLAARGWITLRFTYRAITARPNQVAARIREVVARWAQVRPPDAA